MTTGSTSAKEIAEALQITTRAVRKRADTQGWPSRRRPRDARGGMENRYPLATLPPDVQAALARKAVREEAKARQLTATQTRLAIQDSATSLAIQPVAVASATPLVLYGQARRVVPSLVTLTDKERAVLDSALQLCASIDEARGQTGCSARRACAELAQRVVNGVAHPGLIDAARVTYLRPRNASDVGTANSLRLRLMRMYGQYSAGQKEGDPSRYLVPAEHKGGTVARPADQTAFLTFYCRPARPTVTQAWRNSAPWYAERNLAQPSVGVFHRLQQNLPVTLKNRGRFTGSAWRSIKPYTERDVSMFHANDIWVGDGHTFKAWVTSPIHGKAFRPEVTFVLDWVSRKIVGYSVDLAESTIAVSAAFRDAQLRTRARPLVYYSDNGSGQTGKFIDCDIHGTLARQGIAHETGIPGNPQARGIIERVWSSTVISQASRYATFIGTQADPETARKAGVQIAKDQRAGRISAVPPSWQRFIADLEETVAAYNARPHGSLSGECPTAVYEQKLDPDSLVFGLDDSEIHALWMPEVQRTPRRGLIELFNNKYFMPSLVDILAEGETVRVRFDIHRAETVWVLDMEGRTLGEAQWDGHKRAAFPVAFMDAKREERVERKVAKKAAEAEAARDELMQTIDAATFSAPSLPIAHPSLTVPTRPRGSQAAPSEPAGPYEPEDLCERHFLQQVRANKTDKAAAADEAATAAITHLANQWAERKRRGELDPSDGDLAVGDF